MFALLLTLFACDDTIFPVGEEASGEGWCGVTSVIGGECITCHSAASQLGELDLQTDPTVILSATNAAGTPYVVPGDASQSFFYRKLAGTDLGAGEGTVMPPSGSPSEEVLSIVRTWIDEGATIDACGGTVTDTGSSPQARYHPVGWADPDTHGTEAKLQVQACTTCHGTDLSGDLGPSCDSCHGSPTASDAWRTDCTFCHGEAGGDGSPPRQIDGSLSSDAAAFPVHRSHTEAPSAFTDPLDCSTCHVVPTDVLSSGHLFVDDTTPGVAEVSLASGTWSATDATCAGTCHGTSPFPVTGVADCGSCHGVSQANRLSGEHEDHIDEGLVCMDCHDTADRHGEWSIVRPEQHMNGQVDLALPATLTRAANGDCNGTCHGEDHSSRDW